MWAFSWMHGAVALLIVLVIVGVIIAFARASTRSRRSGDPSPVVSITLSVSAVWAGFAVLGAAIVVLTTLLQPQVQITVPVREFWPQLPDGTSLDGTTATRTGGGFTSADLVVDGLSTGARVCWAIAQALGWLLPGAIAGLIAVACFQLLAGRAFAPVVARMAMVTAVVVTVGGIAAQVLGDVAGSMAATQLLTWTGATYPDVPGVDDVLQAWWPQAGFMIEFPFWPIAAGLGFAALAAIFRYGSRLQRDTEARVSPADDEPTGIHCRLDELLAERGMTLARLSELVGVSVVNLSILKNDRARAIRYSTLAAICRALECDVGELLVTAP